MKRILQIITLLTIVAILASCSVTKKNKSTYKAKSETTAEEKKGIDTTETTKTDLQQQIKSDSSTGSQEETESQKELSINFGNGSAEDFTKDTVLSGVKITTTGPGTVKLNTDGSIEATGNIKNARYKESGKTKRQDSARAATTINTNLQVTDQKKGIDTTQSNAHQVVSIDAQTKEKETTSYWGWLWLALIVAAAVYVCWRFGIFKWFAVLFTKDHEYKN